MIAASRESKLPIPEAVYSTKKRGKKPRDAVTRRIAAILEKSFSDEQREVFEKFHDCWSEYMSLAEASIFEYAFKLGMQIAIETLTDK